MKARTNEIYVAPVKKYAPPKYPTQKEAALAPELLRKLPSRWEKNAAVVAMLGLAALNSCGAFEAKIAGYSPNSDNFLNVAPIFAHGEGTGAIGCDMVAPPVFLSEQEALAIIKSVAGEAGLKFEAAPPEYTATKNKTETKYSWDYKSKYVLGDGEVGMDLYDDKKGVAVSYVSMESAEHIFPNGASTITIYNPRELAELTVEDFAQQNGDIAVGVFYDPGKNLGDEAQKKILDEYYSSEKAWEERMAQYENSAKHLIEEDLRAQVLDFIEWLQAQGII